MNKLFGLFLLALAFLVPSVANAAACFWVGSTGSINDVTHWSSGTGGAGSTCAAAGGWPNSTADTGTFDAVSGGGTITRNVAWTIGTLTTDAFTGTFGNTTDSAAVQLDSWNNSGSGIRTVNLGATTWTCGRAGTARCSWSWSGHTNLTMVASTSTVVMSGSVAGSAQLANWGTSLTYNAITLLPETVSNTLGSRAQNSGTLTIGTLTIGAPNYLNAANSTYNITNLVFSGGTPSLSAWTAFTTDAFGNNANFVLTNPATCNYCIFRDWTATTSAITANNSINLGHLTNITVTPPSAGGGGGGRIIGG